MVWGLILEPEKRYSQVVQKAFHVSNAVLDETTGDNQLCQVLLRSGGANYILCSLQKGKTVQTGLTMYFKAGSEITFYTTGKSTVHLTGFMDPDSESDEEDEESGEEEVSGDEPSLVNVTDKKRKLNSSGEESTKKKPKKIQNGKKAAKLEEENESDSSLDETDLRGLLEGEDADSDEQDNSYRPNDSNISAQDSDDDEEDDDDEDDDEEDDDDDDDDEEEPETEVAPSKKKPDKKKKQQEVVSPQLNGIEKKKNKENQQQQQQQQKKQKNEKKQQNEKPQQPQREKKTLGGGVHIEDLKVGNGPQAVTGKSVQVYYEGRLQSNNKMFDKHLNGPGFKFRLGGKEVISGWDIGVAGMRVGGKRKIICPPNQAYGNKGSPPVIPPNSTLVFEVELKKVN